MKTFEITRDIIAMIVVLGAIASMFFAVQVGSEETVRVLAGAVIGYYFGAKQMPLGAVLPKKKLKK